MQETMESAEIEIQGMHCGSCVRRVQAALAGIPGGERLDCCKLGRRKPPP